MATDKQAIQTSKTRLRYAYEAPNQYGILPVGSSDFKVVWKEAESNDISSFRDDQTVTEREPITAERRSVPGGEVTAQNTTVSFTTDATMDILYDAIQQVSLSDPRTLSYEVDVVASKANGSAFASGDTLTATVTDASQGVNSPTVTWRGGATETTVTTAITAGVSGGVLTLGAAQVTTPTADYFVQATIEYENDNGDTETATSALVQTSDAGAAADSATPYQYIAGTAFPYAGIASGTGAITSYEGTDFISPTPSATSMFHVGSVIRKNIGANTFTAEGVTNRQQAAVAGLLVTAPTTAEWDADEKELTIEKTDAFEDAIRYYGWKKGMMLGAYPVNNAGGGVQPKDIKRWNFKDGSGDYEGQRGVVDAGLFRLKSIDDDEVVLEWGPSDMPSSDISDVLAAGDVDSIVLLGCHAVGDGSTLVTTSYELSYLDGRTDDVEVARGLALNSFTMNIPLQDKSTLSLDYTGQNVDFLDERVSDNSASAVINPATNKAYGANHEVFTPYRKSLVSSNTIPRVRFHEINDDGSQGDVWELLMKDLTFNFTNDIEPEHILGQFEAQGQQLGKLGISIDGEALFLDNRVQKRIKDRQRMGVEIVIGNERDGYLGIMLPWVELSGGDRTFDNYRSIKVSFEGMAKSSVEHDDHCVIVSRIPYLPPVA